MQSAELHEVSTRSELPTKDRTEIESKNDLKMIRNTGKSIDANRGLQGVEEQQVDPGFAPEDDDNAITNVVQDMIADEAKS